MNVEVIIIDGPVILPRDSVGSIAGGVGAVVVFDGVVRGLEQNRPIVALEYEMYQPMAERMMRELAERLVTRYRLTRLAVWHSRGCVPVGHASFRLVVESPHRREALAAVGEFIDALKRDAPIWKRAKYVETPAAQAGEPKLSHRSPTSDALAAQSPAK